MVAAEALDSRSIRSSCLASPRPRRWARRCSGGDDDQALQFIDRLGPTHQNPLPSREYLPYRFTETALTGSGLMGLSERRPRRLDGVNPVVLGTPAPLLVLDLDNVFAGLSQHSDQARGEAAGPFQRPHPSPVRGPGGPRQQTRVTSTVGLITDLA
jgi:hypothetical protein